jgi:hypothetical protein
MGTRDGRPFGCDMQTLTVAARAHVTSAATLRCLLSLLTKGVDDAELRHTLALSARLADELEEEARDLQDLAAMLKLMSQAGCGG